MKKTLIVLSLLAALGTTACDKKDKETTEVAETIPEAQILLDKTEFTEEALLGMIANKEAVTAVEYEALLRGIEKCELDEELLELPYKCAAIKAIKTLTKDDAYSMAAGVDVGEIKGEFLKSDLHQLKSWLIPQLGGLFGVKAEKRNFLLDVAKTNTEPVVTKSIISSLNNEMGDKAVADYILSHVDSENTAIRSAVARAVTSSWSKDVDGIVDIAINFLDDEDKNIRKNTCANIGALGDEKIIDPIVDILNDEEQVYRHGNCMRSLYTLWYDYPFHEKTSEAAYKASLDYLKQTPRSDTLPEWTAVGNAKSVNKNKIEAWKAKATYFNAEEFVAVISEIITDPDYKWIGRSSAIDVVSTWGTKDDLQDIKKKLASEKSSNVDHVMKALDKAIDKKESE